MATETNYYRKTILSDKYILLLILILLHPITGCRNQQEQMTPQAALQELQRRKIEFNAESFLKSAEDGNSDTVNLFLDAGMDPNITDDLKRTALMKAAAMENVEIVKTLLSKGAIVDAKDVDGGTALILASNTGALESIKILLDAGADVNTAEIHGWTPLIFAASTGFHECVKLLLERGSNVNAQAESGNTALMILSTFNDDSKTGWVNEKFRRSVLRIDVNKTAKILVEKGADLNIKNKKDKTALMLAEEKGNIPLVELLKEKS